MIDLTDITFIIPVRIDSSDRLRNLTTSVAYLKKYTNTHIHIIEQDVKPKVPEELALSVEYTFLMSNDPLFYKTLCINDAFKYTTTKYIGVYDADVLLKLNQLALLIKELKSGTSVVYPYDGTFLDVPEVLLEDVLSSLSVESVDDSKCSKGLGLPEITPDRQSFGGAVFFERSAFIKGGMANQHLVSYGPEDAEFYVRFRKLGYKIARIPGPVYHLHHSRGLNSQENHHMVQKNHSEFKKIVDMDANLLTFFVSSWPWARRVV
jgi:hypothetical protein